MSAIRNPWDDWTPAPLPEWEQSLIDELDAYARLIESGKQREQGKSMDAAAATKALYDSHTWSDEWAEVNPVKPNARGTAANHRSFKRFTDWQRHRAEKTNRRALAATRQRQLISAQTIADEFSEHYVSSKSNLLYTETTLRPLSWLMNNGPAVGETYADRIPEVVEMAVTLAAGLPVGEKDMKAAVKLWKEKNTTLQQRNQAKAAGRARTKRQRLDDLFAKMLTDDAETAKEFLRDAYIKFKAFNDSHGQAAA